MLARMRLRPNVRDAMVFIGIAQEKAYAFSAHRLPSKRAILECLIEQSAANDRYRTGSIVCSGHSRPQSCLKNLAHLSNFFGVRTVSRCAAIHASPMA
jgi:hypothetical protein